MPHPFDAASKHMIHAHPADWLALAGLPPGTSMQVSDSDVSLVNMAVDKLIRVEGQNPTVFTSSFKRAWIMAWICDCWRIMR